MRARNITPQNGWNFSALSLQTLFEGMSEKEPFKASTEYLGSRALEEGVRRAMASEADPFVKLVPFPSKTLGGMPKDILVGAKQLILEQIMQAEEEGRGLILSFSAWMGQQSLDVMDLVAFTRKMSGDRVVCIVGGPDLSAYSPRTAAKYFAAGADIVNFGGGKEFADWLAGL